MACASEYKNPLVMTAQLLSIVAFLLSFGWIWTYVVGFCVMLVQQLLWCCPIDKRIFWFLGITSLVASGMNLYVGFAMMNTTSDACFPIFTIDAMCNDMRTFVGACNYASGGLWLIAAVLDLRFISRKQDDEEDAGKIAEAEGVPVPASNV